MVAAASPQDGRGARGVDHLRDGRALAQRQVPEGAGQVHHLGGSHRVDLGGPGGDDLALTFGGGITDVVVQAAALEGGREFAGVVGGQDHPRRGPGCEGAHLGNGDLPLGEDLEQQRLHGLLGAVHLVDEEHHRFRGEDRLEQGAHGEELLGVQAEVLRGEEPGRLGDVGVRGELLADAVAQHLHVQQLLGVVPLVQRAAVVEALVALQPHQPAPAGGGERLGQLGLADAGRALEQQGPLERGGEVDDDRELVVGDVVVAAQRVGEFRSAGEAGHRCSCVVGTRGRWVCPGRVAPPRARDRSSRWVSRTG
ncbi:hypothetical protein AIIKEEIJ_01731 [Rhodococcus sp. YH1]|nr:hypothetical protein [Rhodococcus sp. YH1]